VQNAAVGMTANIECTAECYLFWEMMIDQIDEALVLNPSKCPLLAVNLYVIVIGTVSWKKKIFRRKE
jgi:hypothetical protein